MKKAAKRRHNRIEHEKTREPEDRKRKKEKRQPIDNHLFTPFIIPFTYMQKP
jgi:hypothetical protein